jgi:hypothetical protein
MRISLRRLLVLQFLLLWQGGFVFYTAVVVPAGTAVLGSAAAQGAITARVTDTLNLIGLLSLFMLAAELGLTHDPSVKRPQRGGGAGGFCSWHSVFCSTSTVYSMHSWTHLAHAS